MHPHYTSRLYIYISLYIYIPNRKGLDSRIVGTTTSSQDGDAASGKTAEDLKEELLGSGDVVLVEAR